ncbi:hypothetical protein ACFQ0M_15425 [Kitasatospora aburaviensis]
MLELLADPAELGRWPEAVRVLAGREPEPELLPLVPSLSPAEGEYPLPLLPRAVLKLGVAAVPAAREWAAAGEPWLAGLGHQVLAEYGEAEDIPVLIAELERDWVARAWCGPMYTARGLARFGVRPGARCRSCDGSGCGRRTRTSGPRTWRRWGRSSRRGWTRCTWSASGAVRRRRGCWRRRAPDRPEVRERLAYLRDDPMEAAEVRAAAGERLAALT